MKKHFVFKNNKNKIIILLVFLLVGFSFLIPSINFKKIIKSEIQLIQTHYITFSSGLALFDSGDKKNSENISLNDIFTATKQVLKIFRDGFYFSKNKNLKDIKLIIDLKSLNEIYSDREKALIKGINFNPKYVPCKISDGNSFYDCRVRLKGDLEDHWYSKYRMSLRISVIDGYIHGLKNFSVHKPRARQFPYDQTFHKLNEMIGGLSSIDQRFVNFKFNNKKWGVMNVEPTIDDKFIEDRGLNRLGVFKISNQDNWIFNLENGNLVLRDHYFISDPTLFISQRGNDKQIMKNKKSREIYSQIFLNLNSQNPLIFDRKKMIDCLMISLSWGSLHTLKNSNSLYTWNGYTNKLEPILTDQDHWKSVKLVINSLNNLPFEYKILFRENPITFDEYKSSLTKVDKILKTYDPLKIANDLKNNYFPNDKKFIKSPIKDNLKYLKNNINKTVFWINRLAQVNNQEKINTNFKLENFIDEMNEFVKVMHFTDGIIKIYNLTSQPIFVSKIVFKDKTLKIEKTIEGSNENFLKNIEILTDFRGVNDRKVKVYNSYKNFEKKTRNKYSLINL